MLEKLRKALRLLREARDESGTGTALMLESSIDNLIALVDRYEIINDLQNENVNEDKPNDND